MRFANSIAKTLQQQQQKLFVHTAEELLYEWTLKMPIPGIETVSIVNTDLLPYP